MNNVVYIRQDKSGVEHMNLELLKLKDRLDCMMKDVSPSSAEALELSREIDLLIVEYYRKSCIRSASNYDISGGSV